MTSVISKYVYLMDCDQVVLEVFLEICEMVRQRPLWVKLCNLIWLVFHLRNKFQLSLVLKYPWTKNKEVDRLEVNVDHFGLK